MIFQDKRPIFKKKTVIEGNCLFLIGPIGTFFARLSNFLEENNIRTYKISFPLYEYGFPKSRLIKFHQNIYLFKKYLKKIISDKEIKHIFMYGNVLEPHKQALELCDELSNEGQKVNTHIFELGYLRPNFVTLEDKGVNYESSFILNRDFYDSQSKYKEFPIPKKHIFRIRKI